MGREKEYMGWLGPGGRRDKEADKARVKLIKPLEMSFDLPDL